MGEGGEKGQQAILAIGQPENELQSVNGTRVGEKKQEGGK